MQPIIDELIKQGSQGVSFLLAAAALWWGWNESKLRNMERAEAQKAAVAERDGFHRMLEKERADNQKLQAEIMRLATETSQTNALNRQTLSDLKASLETSKRGRAAAK